MGVVRRRTMGQRMPDFLPFELERWQSDFEHKVEINLADSGVLPLRLHELVEDDPAFGEVLLHYPEVNGNRILRERIAALHPGADADNVLVTVGGSEANQVVAHTLLRPGDRVVVMTPGYLQLCGIAANLGCEVQPLMLEADAGWRLDTERVRTCVTRYTPGVDHHTQQSDRHAAERGRGPVAGAGVSGDRRVAARR